MSSTISLWGGQRSTNLYLALRCTEQLVSISASLRDATRSLLPRRGTLDGAAVEPCQSVEVALTPKS